MNILAYFYQNQNQTTTAKTTTKGTHLDKAALCQHWKWIKVQKTKVIEIYDQTSKILTYVDILREVY